MQFFLLFVVSRQKNDLHIYASEKLIEIIRIIHKT